MSMRTEAVEAIELQGLLSVCCNIRVHGRPLVRRKDD